jgi:hypothetical protein
MRRAGSVITFAGWGKGNAKSKTVLDDANFWLTLDLNKAPLSRDSAEGVLNLEAHLQNMLKDGESDASDPGMNPTELEKSQFIQDARSILRVCINLVLYLNSAEPETEQEPPNHAERAKLKQRAASKNKKKADKAKKRLAQMTEAKIVWIGKSIEEGRPKATKRASNGSGGTRRPHWRKGHFHPYWVGSKKDAEGNPRKGEKQVLRWVAPVFVGDMADMIRARGRIHMFKEDHP